MYYVGITFFSIIANGLTLTPAEHDKMNARQANEQNDLLIISLLRSSKEMATRLNISISEAIDKKVSVYVKYSQSNNEIVAWNIRGEKAKKQNSQI